MNELTQYYEDYFKHLGERGYRMEKAADTSRVGFLIEYVRRELKPGQKILDVGCGDMYLSRAMPEFDWTGVDICLDASEGRAVKHEIGTAPYPFPSASFDMAICSEVLEHLWDLRVVHKEMKRVLKNGALYLVSTPNFDHIDDLLAKHRALLFDATKSHLFEHIRFYNAEVHMQFLRSAGFEPLEVVGADAHYSPFFQHARKTLRAYFKDVCQRDTGQTEVDQVLGRCFPLHSHTVMVLSRSV